VSGIKRHIAVDTNGFPHAIAITTANVTDRAGAIEMVKKNKLTLSRVTNSLVDGGYSGEIFAASIEEILGSTVIVTPSDWTNFFIS
jgi:transposase